MKAKILLLAIIFIDIAMNASAQDLSSTVKSRRADIEIVQNDPRNELAKMNCDNLITAYQESSEDMDRIVNGLDRSWYTGMNLFLAKDMWSIIESIQKYDCYFLNPNIHKVVISQTYQDEYYLVMIYSIKE